MTKNEHSLQHTKLHQSLDELVADFVTHNPKKLPSKATIMELMRWSHDQCDPKTADTPLSETWPKKFHTLKKPSIPSQITNGVCPVCRGQHRKVPCPYCKGSGLLLDKIY